MICKVCQRPIKRNDVRGMHKSCAEWLYDDDADLSRLRTSTDPDRCARCGEARTPKVTLGSIKCKCDQPSMPRHLQGNDSDDRPPMQVRYGTSPVIIK